MFLYERQEGDEEFNVLEGFRSQPSFGLPPFRVLRVSMALG